MSRHYLTVPSLWFYLYRAPESSSSVRFGVTSECQPVTRMSSPFFPVTGEKRTPWKQDIVGAHLKKKKKDLFNCNIVFLPVAISPLLGGGGYCV